jgi:hypothetical protein
MKEKKMFPPKTHDLFFLMREVGIEISEIEYELYEDINSFNILSSKNLTIENFNRIKEKYQWLKEKLNN